MSQKWLDATQKYEQAKKVAEEQRQSETPKQMLSTHTGWLRLNTEIVRVARQLDEFIKSDEGQAAIKLLDVSGRHINFGEEREGGYADVYFIDKNGIGRSVEASGVSWLYRREQPPSPKITRITAYDAIRAAAIYENRKPSEIMTWLRKELNKIADAAGK